MSEIRTPAGARPHVMVRAWLLAAAFLAAAAGGEPDSLSPVIPGDVSITQSQPTLEGLQADFDRFSWDTFVAVNWPVNADGSVDPDTPIGGTAKGDNPTVWETWKTVDDVFRPGGAAPTPWSTPPSIPSACRDLTAPAGARLVRQAGKVPLDLVSTFDQAFRTGPLVDRQGRFVRYEILINQPMYDYIVANTLYSRSGQERFAGPIDFPTGRLDTGAVGAIMVKAAWKILETGDDLARFHAVPALVYTPPSETPRIAESCTLETIGLVGLHIVHRTRTAPQWAWATFEQVDNVPTFNQSPPPSGPYNFYDPTAGGPINTAPDRPWTPDRPAKPTQVVRLVAIPAPTAALNARQQNRFAAVNARSVWQYYALVGTQWPTDPDDPQTNPLGTPAPSFLANTTMETYIQGVVHGDKVTLVPNASSSCMGCHNNATTTTGIPAGFTYMLGRAR